jgi:hypothetical protein
LSFEWIVGHSDIGPKTALRENFDIDLCATRD